MKTALISRETVVEIFPARPILHPSLMAQIRDDAPDDVEQGWTFDGVRYAPPLPPPPLNARDYAAAVQARLDMTAQERDYDNILSACSYVGSAVEHFAREAEALKTWRDSAWAACYAALDNIDAGRAPRPTLAEFVAALPSFSWPS